MPNNLQTKHIVTHALLAALALGLAYVAASWAIDSGRLFAYFLTVIFVAGAAKIIIRAIKQGIDMNNVGHEGHE